MIDYNSFREAHIIYQVTNWGEKKDSKEEGKTCNSFVKAIKFCEGQKVPK